MKHRFIKSTAIFLVLCLSLIVAFPAAEAWAANSTTKVDGKVYEFGKDNDYMFSQETQYTSSGGTSTYGEFGLHNSTSSLTSTGKKNGVPSFTVSEGTISISYTYTDRLLNASENEWHLIEDKEKNVDIFKLDSNIMIGAFILQRSIDHLNWSDVSIQTNVFANTPVQNAALYETLDVELLNGCYYRLIVVYELSRKVGSSSILWVIPNDEYEYKRVAEVYEFYAATDNDHIEALQSNTKRYRLGETVRVDDFASYFGTEEITRNDVHYNWKLGDFFVSGFTSTSENNGEVVFLKNVGDVVTLWFNLNQNIDALNNNANLSITTDPDGYDQYFQTPMTNFGRGMLIIRYTDYENVTHDPVMYYNFLEANTSLGANTRVQLFEEGDYEVALDYEVTKDQVVDKVGHYRIFFKFSVRNANCMVYPFDVKTGRELTNSSVTPNGFYLDLARSRYLNIFIKKEVWAEGATGLTEDTRFNTTAKDGDKYTEEGIYTITVKNQYTGLETQKVIYVGTNRVLLAYMTTNYSIPEILRLVDQGAIIYEDGSIQLPPETYAVTHQFISGTAGTPLPEAVISTLPNDQAGIEDGLEVKPGVIEEAEIRVANGVWKFQGWDSDRKVICGSDLEFVGTWVFEEDVIPTQEAEPISESQTDPLPTSNPQTDTVTETDAPKESDSSPSLESKETETSIVEPTTAENTTGNHAVLYIIGGIVIVAALIAFLILRNKIGKKEEVK